MKNTLVPIDGSLAALLALAFDLRAMHSWTRGCTSSTSRRPWCIRGRENACVPQVRIGSAAAAVIAPAAEHDCDVIVMGTRGMGAVGSLVMGSVAQKVVHLAPVPVTLVK